MRTLLASLKTRLSSEEGQGMVEYAMIIGLVAIGVIVLVTLLGGQVQDIFKSITDSLKSIGGVRTS